MRAERFFRNVEFHAKENFLVFAIQPKLFSVETVFSAAYSMLDKAFVLVDGDPRDMMVVSMQPKEGKGLRALAERFSQQLLNYAVNAQQSAATRQIRECLLRRVFLTQSTGSGQPRAGRKKPKKPKPQNLTSQKPNPKNLNPKNLTPKKSTPKKPKPKKPKPKRPKPPKPSSGASGKKPPRLPRKRRKGKGR
ncbi:MAG: hypothetical protein NTW59_04975 [Candidatus Diapherotrites archaeon]|nr:hypothetical protein [Candidatus Diapherotrites archaeon]